MFDEELQGELETRKTNAALWGKIEKSVLKDKEQDARKKLKLYTNALRIAGQHPAL